MLPSPYSISLFSFSSVEPPFLSLSFPDVGVSSAWPVDIPVVIQVVVCYLACRRTEMRLVFFYPPSWCFCLLFICIPLFHQILFVSINFNLCLDARPTQIYAARAKFNFFFFLLSISIVTVFIFDFPTISYPLPSFVFSLFFFILLHLFFILITLK